ncbi:MAG: Electron transport complex protein RnfG [Candidatus Izimaplasma bacterium HR2]|nr:MAG: Electron transport complex protein RnfG [Candidatus Izimaplasma bacterium HR2]
MKHIKIIFTLTLVVLTASVMVFFVEALTTPIIDEYNIEQANAAKFEVLPGLVANDLKDLNPTLSDFSNTSIEELLIIDGKGYIYTAEFSGYQSKIRYIIGIDLNGTLTGFKVLVQGETPGYGDTITDEEYRLQFEGLSTTDALNGDIDDVAGLSGAPITMGAFRDSLKAVMEFHQSNYEGVVIESPEDRLERWRDEITVVDAIFTDVSADYTMDDTVIKMEIANDGTDDVAVVYTVQFSGFVTTGYVEYLISFDLETNDIIGLRVTHNDESSGIGSILSDITFTPQFDDMLQADALNGDIDEVAGGSAPITYSAFIDSLEEVILFHQAIYQVAARADNIEVVNADLLLAFPTGITFTSVYTNYAYNEFIGNIYEVYDGSNVLLGYVYYVQLEGRDDDINFVLGIDIDGNTLLIEILYSAESWDAADEHGTYDGNSGEFPDTVWIDNFEGVSILDLILDPVDDIAGVSTTTGSMLEAIEEVLQYHLFELVGGAN